MAMSLDLRRSMALKMVQAGVYEQPKDDNEPALCICLGCTAGACWSIQTMDSAPREAFCRHLRVEYRDFFIQLMQFVTQARDSRSIGALDTRIRVIHEQCPHGETEDDVSHGQLEYDRSTSELLLEHVFTFLDVIITSTRILAHRNPFTTSGGWPTSASDAGPFGPQVTAATLLDWWIRLDSTAGDVGLDRFLSILRPTIARVFVTHRTIFAERAIATWDMLALKVLNGTSTSSDHRRFTENVHLLVTVAAILNGGEGLTERMFGGLESALFTALFRMVQAAEKMEHIPVHTIGACALNFSNALRCDLPALQYTRYLQSARDQIVKEADTSNIYSVFHHDLHRSYRPRVCMRDGCEARDTNENHMRRCGRCRLFVYCSPECQKAGWTADYLPHKLSCAKFEAVFRVADYNKSVEHFVRRCKVEKISAYTLGELKFFAYSAGERRPTLTPPQQMQAIKSKF